MDPQHSIRQKGHGAQPSDASETTLVASEVDPVEEVIFRRRFAECSQHGLMFDESIDVNWMSKVLQERLDIPFEFETNMAGSSAVRKFAGRRIISRGTIIASWRPRNESCARLSQARFQIADVDEDEFDVIFGRGFHHMANDIVFEEAAPISLTMDLTIKGNWISVDILQSLDIDVPIEAPQIPRMKFQGRVIISRGSVEMQWTLSGGYWRSDIFQIADVDTDDFDAVIEESIIESVRRDSINAAPESLAVSQLNLSEFALEPLSVVAAPTSKYANFLAKEASHDSIACEEADKWIKEFKDCLHYRLVPNPDSPIKIAVLDTGFNDSNPVIQGLWDSWGERVKDARNFKDSKKVWNVDDQFGHGTHITALLLDLAPKSHIYIAKISDDEYIPDFDAVEKAIEYAATTWNVDIISMSFALDLPATDERRRRIHETIDKHGKKVVMFAAARNDGGNKAVAFPANHRDVICVRSTAYDGKRSRASPLSDQDSGNFATLGEAVKAPWGDGEAYKSGSSFATPIAVAYYADVLAFAAPHFTEQEYKLLRSQDGALKLFDISSPSRKIRYVRPHERFAKERSEQTIITMIRDKLVMDTTI